MCLNRTWILLLASLGAAAQISPPKQHAADYPAHVTLPNMELAAEYLVHSLPGPRGMIFAHDYLIIEVAAYPTKVMGAAWDTSQFTLRINKKRPLLSPDAPGMVAASIKYPDWERHPTAVAGVDAGNGNISIGQPASVPRFPGDPADNRLPTPGPPEPEQRSAENAEPEMSMDEICQKQALYDGPFRKPTNGFLYFQFSGKLKSIHSLELLYETADGVKATLTLL